MVAAHEPLPSSPRGPRGEFVPDVTQRPVWRLLVRGLGVFLPEWEAVPGALHVVNGQPHERPGLPVVLDRDSGFGLQLRARAHGLEPDREIYVRGKEKQSFGIVISGPSAAIGTRVVDAAGLLRYARRLIFEELYDSAEVTSVPAAVRAARSVEGVVFLDRAAGVGLCAEIDPVSHAARCPLALRFGGGSNGTVRTYAVGGWLAQPVSSQT